MKIAERGEWIERVQTGKNESKGNKIGRAIALADAETSKVTSAMITKNKENLGGTNGKSECLGEKEKREGKRMIE